MIRPFAYDIRHALFVIDGGATVVSDQRVDPATDIVTYTLSDGSRFYLKPQAGRPIVDNGEIVGYQLNHGIDLDAPGRSVDDKASTFTNPPLIIHLIKAS